MKNVYFCVIQDKTERRFTPERNVGVVMLDGITRTRTRISTPALDDLCGYLEACTLEEIELLRKTLGGRFKLTILNHGPFTLDSLYEEFVL